MLGNGSAPGRKRLQSQLLAKGPVLRLAARLNAASDNHVYGYRWIRWAFMVVAQDLGEGRLARMFFIERVSVERGTR
jgi:hypothetical protein